MYQSIEDYRTMAMLANAINLLELTWAKVMAGSIIENKTIGELAIRRKTGCSFVAVMRKGELHLNPDADFRFETGDIAGVIGGGAERKAVMGLLDIS